MFFSELEFVDKSISMFLLYRFMHVIESFPLLFVNELIHFRRKAIPSFDFPFSFRSTTYLHAEIYTSLHKTTGQFSKPLCQSPINELS